MSSDTILNERHIAYAIVDAAHAVGRGADGPKRGTKVAAARKLAVRLYWMMRQNVGYPEIALIESSSGVPLTGENQVATLNEPSRTQH